MNSHGRPTRYRIKPGAPSSEPIELGAETLMRALNFSNERIGSPEKSLRSSFIEVQREGGRFLISGRGFGHGAGLCQYGAQVMGKDGQPHSEILAWYYPGATLLKSYQ